MAKVAGTQVAVGLGLESTPGTAVAPTIYPKWRELSMQAVSEKTMLNAARGVRIGSLASRVRRKFAQGSLAVVPNVEIAPYLFYMALGSLSTAANADASGTVKDHTITANNSNASMKTGTLVVEQGSVVTERYANVTCNALNLEVSDDWAQMSVDLLGNFPDTSTLTESYTEETEFIYSDYTLKLGADLAAAAAASATPIKSFALNINNNVLVDEAFLSGNNEPVAGGFVAGRMQITGSYSIALDGTTHLDYYKNATELAAIVSFQGASIGTAETEEVQIKLGKMVFTSPPKEYNLDGIIILNQEFEVLRDVTDGDITVVVTNETASY